MNVRQKTAGLSCKMQLRARQRDSQGAAGFGSWQQILSPNIAPGLNSTQDVQLGGSNFVMRYSYIYIVRLWEEKNRRDFLFLEVKLSSGASVYHFCPPWWRSAGWKMRNLSLRSVALQISSAANVSSDRPLMYLSADCLQCGGKCGPWQRGRATRPPFSNEFLSRTLRSVKLGLYFIPL